MSNDQKKPTTPAEAVEMLRKMGETNKAVADLLTEFIEHPVAGNPAAVREFQNHQNKIILHLILNQQKQVKTVETVLATFAAQTLQNSQALAGVAAVLKKHGLLTAPSADGAGDDEQNDPTTENDI